MSLTVLICDDNISVHKSIEGYLREDGLEVISVYDGESAMRVLRTETVHLVILDIMLPGKSGIEICREIRKSSDLPILFLSAKGTEIDRIVGFEVGADDYVTKPFSPREVSLRARKILSRIHKPPESKKYTVAELSVYPDLHTAYVNGILLDLSPKEMKLLGYLAYNAGRILNREIILSAVWGYDYTGDTRTVDTHVKRLRQKLPSENVHFAIRSVYGIGYTLEECK